MFQRESKEQILDKMIRWSRAVSPKVTDFRRGSVIRTVYEAVAGVVEGLYDRVYRAVKRLIESNLYSTLSFDKIQAQPSSGLVTFSRSLPATKDIVIPAGTEVVAHASSYRAPLVFRTVDETVLRKGYTTVNTDVVCAEAGAIGNIDVGEITDFVQKPLGIEAVTNPEKFLNGADEETSEEQKVRFQEFMEASTRGSLQSIDYGAKQAYVTDENGNMIEQVLQSKSIEYLPERKGEVDLYVWNGVGAISQELEDRIQEVLKGYYDKEGNRVYGYKNAGTWINVYPANAVYAKIRLNLTVEEWASEQDIKTIVNREVDSYFYRLRIGQTLIHSELLTKIKNIEGVYDIRVDISTDNGETYNTNNVTVGETDIVVKNELTYV